MGASDCVSTGFSDLSFSALLSIKLTSGTEQALVFTVGLLLAGIALCRMNGFVLMMSRERFSRQKNLVNRGYLSLLSVLLFSSLVAFLFLFTWNRLFQPTYDSKTLIDCFVLLVSFPVLFTFFDENQSLNSKRQRDDARSQRLRMQTELKLLKDEIDPHFFFNSLNTMSYLIDHDPVNAKRFNDRLAEVYRYIVINKQKSLVPLKEELAFIQNYFSLLTIRYPQGLNISIDAEHTDHFDSLLLPPVSLQLLVENAIKHNDFSKDLPLQIIIAATDEYVSVSNVVNKKMIREDGCRSGLKNLSARYELSTGKKISVSNRSDYFMVKLPLVKADPNV